MIVNLAMARSRKDRQPRVPSWLRRRRAMDAERRAVWIGDVVRRRRAERRFTLLFLALFLAALASLFIVARTAHPAVRVPLSWTAPDSVRHYEVIARRPDGVDLAISLFAESTGTAPMTLASGGARQRGWVLVSEDWRSGGWLIRLRGCNGAGCAQWSNRVLVAAGIPDTLWTLERPDGSEGCRTPRDSTLWKHAAGRVSWSLQSGDTAGASVVHQELIQLRWRDRICELFRDSTGSGFWVRRGQREACP